MSKVEVRNQPSGLLLCNEIMPYNDNLFECGRIHRYQLKFIDRERFCDINCDVRMIYNQIGNMKLCRECSSDVGEIVVVDFIHHRQYQSDNSTEIFNRMEFCDMCQYDLFQR